MRESEEQKWAIIASASAELLSASEVDRAAEKITQTSRRRNSCMNPIKEIAIDHYSSSANTRAERLRALHSRLYVTCVFWSRLRSPKVQST